LNRELGTLLDAMAALDGMVACALVERDTGMVWHCAGHADGVLLAEAASDYWRLCGRQDTAFAPLGPLRAQVAIHADARLTLVGCGEGLLLVAISREPDRVDWQRWKQAVGALQAQAARW
jgi:hypothetical protein